MIRSISKLLSKRRCSICASAFGAKYCSIRIRWSPVRNVSRVRREDGGVSAERTQSDGGGAELFEGLQGRTLQLYPNADIRLAMSRAIAIETARGWRIAKEKQNHKIDVVIALAMSALASVRSPGESNYDSQYLGWSDTPSEVLTTGRRDFYGMRFIS